MIGNLPRCCVRKIATRITREALCHGDKPIIFAYRAQRAHRRARDPFATV